MSDDGYRSPLGTRYSSPAMQRIWGESYRAGSGRTRRTLLEALGSEYSTP
jgi:hypothetical protein